MLYTLYSYVWFFIIYSFLGWCVEVCFCTIHTGKAVNRGFLNGPVCPIYGFGMLFLIICLKPFQNNLFLLYVGAVFLTSLLEFVAGFVLKKMFHTSWWDYSDLKYNLGGYICLKFSLAWGVGGVLAIKIVHPIVDWLVGFSVASVGAAILCILLIVLICDAIVTVNVIAKLNKDLGKIAQVASFLHHQSDSLADTLGGEALSVESKIEDSKEVIDEKKAAGGARLDILRAEILDSKNFLQRRLLNAFPKMKNEKYDTALSQLKVWYGSKNKK